MTRISNISGPTICIFISTFKAEYIFSFFLAATKRRHTARLPGEPRTGERKVAILPAAPRAEGKIKLYCGEKTNYSFLCDSSGNDRPLPPFFGLSVVQKTMKWHPALGNGIRSRGRGSSWNGRSPRLQRAGPALPRSAFSPPENAALRPQPGAEPNGHTRARDSAEPAEGRRPPAHAYLP